MKKRFKIKRKINELSAFASNPTVSPDTKTEMGVAIPDEQNVEYSKEYQEENEL